MQPNAAGARSMQPLQHAAAAVHSADHSAVCKQEPLGDSPARHGSKREEEKD